MKNDGILVILWIKPVRSQAEHKTIDRTDFKKWRSASLHPTKILLPGFGRQMDGWTQTWQTGLNRDLQTAEDFSLAGGQGVGDQFGIGRIARNSGERSEKLNTFNQAAKKKCGTTDPPADSPAIPEKTHSVRKFLGTAAATQQRENSKPTE